MNNLLSSAIDIAEDDQSRSNYARKLIQSSRCLIPSPSPDPHPIPKRIVQYWDDSNHIPEDVQECLESWASLGNLGFHRLMFDDRSAKRFISTELGSPYTGTDRGSELTIDTERIP
jgi:mannosyltransferase OCH1-like enzyme